MSTRTGRLGNLKRDRLQRRLAEPQFVLASSHVNDRGKLFAPVATVKCHNGRQVTTEGALAIFQIGQRCAVLNLERSSVNRALKSVRRRILLLHVISTFSFKILKIYSRFDNLLRIFTSFSSINVATRPGYNRKYR